MEASARVSEARASRGEGDVPSKTVAPASSGTNIVTVDVARPVGGTGTTAVSLLIVVILLLGWQGRQESALTSESGLGYALGIVGGGLMLFLLLYPLRKRVRAMRRWFSIRIWFEIHIWFGIAGPILILFHSNFSFGSTNANVALIAMIVVTLSGIVGRYLYGRVHCGLHGRKANLTHFRLGEKVTKVKLAPILVHSPQLQARLEAFEIAARKAPAGLLQGSWRALIMTLLTRWTYMKACRQLKAGLKRQARHKGWKRRERRRQLRLAKRQLATYLATVRQIAEFSLFERLFSYWHVLHLPMFLLLVVTGLIHVLAVHMY